jgi:type III pantothenate kinase
MMLLCIDLGNTNITFGLYEGDHLQGHWRVKTDHDKMPDEYAMLFLNLLGLAKHRPQDVTGICMCSVVPPLTGVFDQMCTRYFDRSPLIVDAGTATTFDAISREGDYLGGAIAPGIGIAAEALFARAAKLPRIDLVRPPGPIGSNTVHSMQSGLIFGYVGLVEGMVARFRAELGDDMHVIGTGGLAQTIARETDVIHEVDPWITLKGLRIVWELNQQ